MISNHDILDDFYTTRKLNPKGIYKFGTLFLLTILSFIFLSILEYQLSPESWKDNNEPSWITILTIMIFFLINSIQVPKFLNVYDPEMPIIMIILISGLNLFLITFIFKFIQNLIIFQNGLNQNYYFFIKSGILFFGLGAPISNIRIQSLRNNKLIWPIILLLALWYVVVNYFM